MKRIYLKPNDTVIGSQEIQFTAIWNGNYFLLGKMDHGPIKYEIIINNKIYPIEHASDLPNTDPNFNKPYYNKED